MSPAQTLLARWREANQRAYEAENQLFAATMEYISGRAPKPADGMTEDAKRLRALATELLEEVVANYGSQAQTFTRGSSPPSPADRH